LRLERVEDWDGVRRLLRDHAPWSPRDFVPNISKAGDREIVADELCRPIEPADDFRFVARGPSGPDLLVLAERLKWDSEFFALGIAKLHGVWPARPPLHRRDLDLRGALEGLLEACRRRDLHYLFAPVDPRDLSLLRALGDLGFALIETRWIHHSPVTPPVLEDRLGVRRAVEADVPSLARTAAQMVNPYDRFHADPFFRREDVDRLMEKWVEESVRGRMADVVIVPDAAEPTAFVTYRYHRDRWPRWGRRLAQGVLSAASPEYLGWMGRVGPEVLHHLHGVGVEHVYGTTQATNESILWFAQEQGARFGRCELIFRKVLS
jgi:dTDP-4-amino-4,6-dideoxy-D-galactose acyltransferase